MNAKHPYKQALAASLNLTATAQIVATQLGTAACPVPGTTDPDILAAYRHAAATVLLLSRRVNGQIERGFPHEEAA